MANEEHLGMLRQGVNVWNRWREVDPMSLPDLIRADFRNANLSEADLSFTYLSFANLSEADLRRADLSEADLKGSHLSGADLEGVILYQANLSRVNLSRAKLKGANLREANLSGAHLEEANLSGANLSGANLSGANLSGADLSDAHFFEASLSRANLSGANLSLASLTLADLSFSNLSFANLRGARLSNANLRSTKLEGADLTGVDLRGAALVHTDLTNAKLGDCRIEGISLWNVQLEGAEQHNLIIRSDYPAITVDNLKMAQFICLLLNDAEIREVIDTLARKAVLILGHFDGRKAILDTIREALRIHGYLPILFDFGGFDSKPSSQDLTETVKTLACLSRFIIADLTDPGSMHVELYAFVPPLPIPVCPILLEGQRRYLKFGGEKRESYDWVLPIYHYRDQDHLLAMLQEQMFASAEQKAREMTPPR